MRPRRHGNLRSGRRRPTSDGLTRQRLGTGILDDGSSHGRGERWADARATRDRRQAGADPDRRTGRVTHVAKTKNGSATSGLISPDVMSADHAQPGRVVESTRSMHQADRAVRQRPVVLSTGVGGACGLSEPAVRSDLPRRGLGLIELGGRWRSRRSPSATPSVEELAPIGVSPSRPIPSSLGGLGHAAPRSTDPTSTVTLSRSSLRGYGVEGSPEGRKTAVP